MKMRSFFFTFCLASLFAAVTVSAQQGSAGQFWYGFTDSQGSSAPQGSSGQQFGYGFTGPSQTIPVAQTQTYSHKSPVIIKGNIVQAIGGDLYLFRDSSGEIVLKIGAKEWQFYGSTISSSDTIEIHGEVHRKIWQQPEVHARFIRKL